MTVLRPCYVAPSGLTAIGDKLVRVAVGAPADPASLHHDGPHCDVPWRNDAALEAALNLMRAGLQSPRAADAEAALGRMRAARTIDAPKATYVDMPAWAEALDRPRRWKALSGGRGSAKSRTAVRRLILDHVRGPQTTLCAREYMASIRASAHRLIATQIRTLGLQDHFEILAHEIRDQHGGVITFAGLQVDPDAIRSLEGLTRVFLEEGHSLTRTGLDVLAPTVREAGAEITVAWNPHRPDDPVQDLTKPDRDDVCHVHSTYQTNPWLSLDILHDAERDRADPDKHTHVWAGGFKVKSSARVFRNVEVADLDAAVAEQNLPERAGMDLGFNDPCVALQVFIIPARDRSQPDTFYIAREAYLSNLPIDQRPALVAGSDRRAELGETPRWPNPRGLPGVLADQRTPVVIDSAEPATIELFRKAGLKPVAARKGAGSVALGVERLQAYKIVVHPRCENAVRELRGFSYAVDRKTGAILDEFDHEHSHVPDACRYVLDGIRRNVFPSRRLLGDDARPAETLPPGWGCELIEGFGRAQGLMRLIIAFATEPAHAVLRLDRKIIKTNRLRPIMKWMIFVSIDQ